jgi:hypothetical protein
LRKSWFKAAIYKLADLGYSGDSDAAVLQQGGSNMAKMPRKATRRRRIVNVRGLTKGQLR